MNVQFVFRNFLNQVLWVVILQNITLKNLLNNLLLILLITKLFFCFVTTINLFKHSTLNICLLISKKKFKLNENF